MQKRARALSRSTAHVCTHMGTDEPGEYHQQNCAVSPWCGNLNVKWMQTENTLNTIYIRDKDRIISAAIRLERMAKESTGKVATQKSCWCCAMWPPLAHLFTAFTRQKVATMDTWIYVTRRRRTLDICRLTWTHRLLCLWRPRSMGAFNLIRCKDSREAKRKLSSATQELAKMSKIDKQKICFFF